MSTESPQPGFPTMWAIAAMSLAAVLAVPVAWFGVPIVVDGAQAMHVVVPVMVLVVWGMSVAAVLPVALLGPLGVMHTVAAYFAGTAVRVVGCLLAWIIVVRGFEFPAAASGLTLMVVYLPLLFVEVAFVGRYLWLKDQPTGQIGMRAVTA